MSFMSDLFDGLIDDPLEKINDYIDMWHNGEGTKMSLHKFLGFTTSEYGYYLDSPKQFFDSPVLVKINDNWADEMDVEGFVIMDLKSLYAFYNGVNDFFKEYPNESLNYSIGTNEDIDHDSPESIFRCITAKFITEDQSQTIKSTIGSYYGVTNLLDILSYA